MAGETRSGVGSWAAGINLLLGLWLIVGHVLGMATGDSTSPGLMALDFLLGIVIIATSLWAIRSASTGPYWIQVLIGAWLAVQPIVVQFGRAQTGDTNAGYHNIFVGVIVALLALFGALARTGPAGRSTPSA